MAGKTIGQLVNYVVNMQEFDLVMTTEFSEINTMSPLLVVITTGGLSGDGNADCSISCGDINSGDISRVSQQGDGNYRHEFRFRNVGNGVHSCSVNCDDDLADNTREKFGKDISFTINTPALAINIVSPVDGREYSGSLRLIVETRDGVYDGKSNDGDADCYYAGNLIDDFTVGDITDITRRVGISSRNWAKKMCSTNAASCKRDFGGGFEFTESLRGLERGSITLWVQCKDRAGKLAPATEPARVEFIVT